MGLDIGHPVAEPGNRRCGERVLVDTVGVEQPVMHACGHDVHITSLVGAARQLHARRGRWSGTLVLIAQPASPRARTR